MARPKSRKKNVSKALPRSSNSTKGGDSPFPHYPLSMLKAGDDLFPWPWIRALGGEAVPWPWYKKLKDATPIYSMESIRVSLLKTNPPLIQIDAVGWVNSTGWSDGHLVPRVYANPPADGIFDFDFAAVPPSGIVIWVFCRIAATTVWTNGDVSQVKGVRIHAATGSMEALLGSGMSSLAASATPTPMGPFAFGAPADHRQS
jgi:hypothetical protein